MAGRPITRTRREAAPTGGPLEWAARARPGVFPPMNGNGNGNGHGRGSLLEEVTERRRQSAERQLIDADMDEEAAEVALRNRRRAFEMTKLEIQEQRLIDSLTGGRDESSVADVIREMNAANRESFERLVTLLTKPQRDHELEEVKALVRGLEGKLQEALARPGQADDPFGTSGLEKALQVVDSIESRINARRPTETAAPAVEPGMTKEQVLRQIAIEEEADLRRAELKERREDREFAREQAREQAKARRARLASAAGMVDQYLGPVLAAIMGSKARDMLGGGEKVTATATVNNNRKAYQCPECNAVNWEDINVHVTDCPNCGLTLDPFPMTNPDRLPAADAEPHHHHDHPLEVLEGGPDDQ